MSQSHNADVLVVGGGIIGLAVAWRARQRGMSVIVLERDCAGHGTSHVAAGMLAPIAEVEFGDAGRTLLDLGLRSAEMWGGFAAELEAAADMGVGLMRTGTLLLARDDDDARELERQLVFRQSLGLAIERLRPSEARDREPALAPTVRLALEAPDDHSVDPRLVMRALRRACDACGVDIREHSPVASVELGGDPEHTAGEEYAASEERNAGGAHVGLRGVVLASGERVFAPHVVLAAGPWTADIDGLPAHASIPVRPVKGQILRLRDPAGPGLLQRVLRFDGGYVVPRGDGRYVLGATVEERGFSLQPTVGPIYELLRDAHEILPGISELDIEELSVGLRPGTPDNAPVIGPGAVDGLVWATGHYRNGILLAPLTAQLVAAGLTGEDMPAPLLSACAAERFTAAAHNPPLHAVGPPVGAV